MLALTHRDLTDKEKMFYEGEAKFVDSSAQHFRALATIAATELGFLVTALTLAGTSKWARTFVEMHTAYGAAIFLLLLACIVVGSLQGRLMALMLLHGNRANFLPDDARVSLSQKHASGETNFTNEQYAELLSISDRSGLKNKKKFERYARLGHFATLLATLSFILANVVAVVLVLSGIHSWTIIL